VTALGRALAALGESYELMAVFAAYTGLRWGELAAVTIGQVDPGTRTVTVDRKVIEIGGTLHVEPPKGVSEILCEGVIG
jgi:integrase